MNEPKLDELSKRYPSVDLAYRFAVDSYDISWKRWDAIDARLHGLMSLAVALTLAIPATFKIRGLALNAIWIYLILATFVMLVGVGSYARLMGSLKVIEPSVLYDKFLHFSDWEFKKNLIYWAGVHYDFNRRMIYKKWRLTIIVTCLFGLEVVWVALLALSHP